MVWKVWLKNAVSLVITSIALICGIQSIVLAQPAQNQAGPAPATATLYSILTHHGEQRDFCLSFQKGPLGWGSDPCDLRYGGLFMGEYRDWFESPLTPDNRSVIKDLGTHAWTEDVKAPVLKPLAKLKPGQTTVFTLGSPASTIPASRSGDASDPGTDDLRTRYHDYARSGRSMRDFGEVVVPSPRGTPPAPAERTRARSTVKAPPLVKSVPGHLYVMRVVNDPNDFYALFRVESLEKLIPSPPGKLGK